MLCPLDLSMKSLIDSVEKNEINIDKNKVDEFEFNQDNSGLNLTEEYRSPGWDRYKKNKILKWKK